MSTLTKGKQKIFERVQEVLVDALGLDDPYEPTMEATLMGDLGAESIDFLDIIFRLEKAFGIKIPRDEIFPAESILENPDFVASGEVTPAGLIEMKKRMSHTDIREFERNPKVDFIADLFTVASIVEFMKKRISITLEEICEQDAKATEEKIRLMHYLEK